jgi:hypothetical protein
MHINALLFAVYTPAKKSTSYRTSLGPPLPWKKQMFFSQNVQPPPQKQFVSFVLQPSPLHCPAKKRSALCWNFPTTTGGTGAGGPGSAGKDSWPLIACTAQNRLISVTAPQPPPFPNNYLYIKPQPRHRPHQKTIIRGGDILFVRHIIYIVYKCAPYLAVNCKVLCNTAEVLKFLEANAAKCYLELSCHILEANAAKCYSELSCHILEANAAKCYLELSCHSLRCGNHLFTLGSKSTFRLFYNGERKEVLRLVPVPATPCIPCTRN